jgi:hypothetical protein
MNIVSLALFSPRQGKQIFSLAAKSVTPYQPSGICDVYRTLSEKARPS